MYKGNTGVAFKGISSTAKALDGKIGWDEAATDVAGAYSEGAAAGVKGGVTGAVSGVIASAAADAAGSAVSRLPRRIPQLCRAGVVRGHGHGADRHGLPRSGRLQ